MRDFSPIINRLRTGSAIDPYVEKVEYLTVKNSILFLAELPSKFDGVIISGYSEVSEDILQTIGLLDADQYVVDYKNGSIYFNSSENDKQVTVAYKGRGIAMTPADRIYYSEDGVIQSLHDIIEEAVDKTTEASSAIAYAKAQGDYAKAQGTLANDKATLADQKATLASTAASNADTKGAYAKDQGDFAKAQGEDAQAKANEAVTIIAQTITAKDEAIAATDVANISAQNAEAQALFAKNQGDYAKSKADYVDTATQDLETLKSAINTAIDNANTASSNANEEAQNALEQSILANDASVLANEKATLADSKAVLAEEKALLAQSAALNADEKADLAESQASYAKNQGDAAKLESENLSALKNEVVSAKNEAINEASYAKSQGDYAKSQGELATDALLNLETITASATTAINDVNEAKTNTVVATQAANNASASAIEAIQQMKSIDPNKKGIENACLYYGYPIGFNGLYDRDKVSTAFSKYDVLVLGDTYQKPTQEVYADTVEIIRLTKIKNSATQIFGYVPIGANPNILTSNLPIAEIKTRIDEWAVAGATGIFLDEYGYDYYVTRERQNEIVNYVHSKNMNVIANSWQVDYVFSSNSLYLSWLDFEGNANSIPPVINDKDYILFENAWYYERNGEQAASFKDQYDSETRMHQAYYYHETIQGNGQTYFNTYRTKSFALDAIKTNIPLATAERMAQTGKLASIIMKMDAYCVSSDSWGASGTYREYTLNNFQDLFEKSKSPIVPTKLDTAYFNVFTRKINGKDYRLDWTQDLSEPYVYTTGTRKVSVGSQQSEIKTIIGDDIDRHVKIGEKINASEKGVPNGIPTLDENGKVTSSQLPPIASSWDTLTDKPSLFPSTEHTHSVSDVVGLEDALSNAVKMASYPYLITATQGQNSFIVPVETFDKVNDLLVVVINGRHLATDDYSIVDKTVTFTEQLSAGDSIYGYVLKNVPKSIAEGYSGANLADGTVAKSKLSSEVVASLNKADSALQSVPVASDTVSGTVVLDDTANSSSTTKAATANSVKSVSDRVTTNTNQISVLNDKADNLKMAKSDKDANGIYTTVTYRRKADDTIFATSVLSGGASPTYTTRTITYYELNGTTIRKTVTFTLTYDADGVLVSEV